MAAIRANRPKVGSVSWISEERDSANQFVLTETEEFIYSARNEIDWLNEHMAEIFNGKQVDLVEILKTPGKLRGKTPRTVRKNLSVQERPPLSSIFSTTPRVKTASIKSSKKVEKIASFQVVEDSVQAEPPPKTLDFEQNSPLKISETNVEVSNSSAHPDIIAKQRSKASKSPSLEPKKREQAALSQENFNLNEDEIDEIGLESGQSNHAYSSFPSPDQEKSRKTQSNLSMDAHPVVNFENHDLATSEEALYPTLRSPTLIDQHPTSSSKRATPKRNSPRNQAVVQISASEEDIRNILQLQQSVDNQIDEANSASEASSPPRPIVRQNSLNFASLPAREPITTKKSIGNYASRASQSDNSRTSYYPRTTSGNGVGNAENEENHCDLRDDQVNNDSSSGDADSTTTRLHNKTSTQRLQDQISKLGQSQKSFRLSKSTTGSNSGQLFLVQPSQQVHTSLAETKLKSPKLISELPMDQFPKEDSLINHSFKDPAESANATSQSSSPQNKSTSSIDCAVDDHSVGQLDPNILGLAEQALDLCLNQEIITPDTGENAVANHVKSFSVSDINSPQKHHTSPRHKNQDPVFTLDQSVSTSLEEKYNSVPKSSLRNPRGSPLKAAKDKFSMILKNSKHLFATSAVASASANSELTSSTEMPDQAEIEVNTEARLENLDPNTSETNCLHPNEIIGNEKCNSSLEHAGSSPKISPRRTRGSTEQERKRIENEVKFSKCARSATVALGAENDLEFNFANSIHKANHTKSKQIPSAISSKEETNISQTIESVVQTKQNDIKRATRISPRKTKAQLGSEKAAATTISVDENQDIEMPDLSAGVPLPAIPRPKTQIGRPNSKRPLKPAKEVTKTKPPTIIRVDTGSQRGHQFHPSNATLSATLKESLSTKPTAASNRLRNRTSTSSAQSKSSSNSFRLAATKNIEAAARKKEQDELVISRKREAKLEIGRKRAAIRDEERQKEQKRRQEVENQREIQRERDKLTTNSDFKNATSRQVIEKGRFELEKAKETRPPQSYIREKAGLDLDKVASTTSALELPYYSKTPANIQRVQQDQVRPPGSSIISNTRIPPKRPLLQENEDHHLRQTVQRNGASFQRNEHQLKRHKTNDFDVEDDEEAIKSRSKMTAPPIRQSGIRQKETSTKSIFSNGHVNAVPPPSLQRSTLISQHHLNQSKITHPIDMVQIAKGPIPFASSFNQGSSQTHKTPARPSASNSGGKSITKAGPKNVSKPSPRYPNGETIELPEIHTDSDDEDSENEGGNGVRPGWTDTPEIQKQLAYQESIDPTLVFGQPGPLNMEEVFSKSKDRFHKFRARTSSANWSGTDKLTDDEIQRDLEGRNRVRRQGGWTYDAMV